jgi:hemolysin-activating ACP:hemolysin acyltransferase
MLFWGKRGKGEASAVKEEKATNEEAASVAVAPTELGAVALTGQKKVEAPGLVAPALMKNSGNYSRGLLQAFGSVMAMCMRSKVHRRRTLADLEATVAPALLNGQFSLAEMKHQQNGSVTPIAAVLWASVSDDVDRRIAVEGFRLQPSEWNSGKIIWVVEVVGDGRMLKAMVKRLREKAWKGRVVKICARGADGKWSGRLLQSGTA